MPCLLHELFSVFYEMLGPHFCIQPHHQTKCGIVHMLEEASTALLSALLQPQLHANCAAMSTCVIMC